MKGMKPWRPSQMQMCAAGWEKLCIRRTLSITHKLGHEIGTGLD
jgi:hypothetical protein